ncbi:MAG: hypothetical protein R3D26_10670 [Cyanobacteriota/Melainabacteria group bacterium]
MIRGSWSQAGNTLYCAEARQRLSSGERTNNNNTREVKETFKPERLFLSE